MMSALVCALGTPNVSILIGSYSQHGCPQRVTHLDWTCGAVPQDSRPYTLETVTGRILHSVMACDLRWQEV